jgi:hypothetical protein
VLIVILPFFSVRLFPKNFIFILRLIKPKKKCYTIPKLLYRHLFLFLLIILLWNIFPMHVLIYFHDFMYTKNRKLCFYYIKILLKITLKIKITLSIWCEWFYDIRMMFEMCERFDDWKKIWKNEGIKSYQFFGDKKDFEVLWFIAKKITGTWCHQILTFHH